MVTKAALLLLLLSGSVGPAHALTSFELGLRDAITRNDWAEQVVLLTPKKGQNFEHDLQLARALFQLERRLEGLKVLASLWALKKDERALRLLQSGGAIFFSQDSSSLFFEGVRMLGDLKFAEAKEKFEQVLVREPGHVLALIRLIQAEIQLDQTEMALAHFKEVSPHAPYSNELRFFGLKLSGAPDGSLRRPAVREEVPWVIWMESLRLAGREDEIRGFYQQVSDLPPDWAYARVWLFLNGGLSLKQRIRLKSQIDLALKDKGRFEEALRRQMKLAQNYWVGFIRYEELMKQMR